MRAHFKHKNGERQHAGENQIALQPDALGLFFLFRVVFALPRRLYRSRLIPRFFNRRDHRLRRRRPADGGALRRQIHRSVRYARHSLNTFFNASDARRAGHTFNKQAYRVVTIF
ncbi:Uncharacterised protein [Salmonella enterica subsp. enterica serovar Bovismorbificans]|uniref:Uncharacterized protein n=1 Tax=Salmonella enterica subsp. enterica serovar Bovismorbificans TaxID=58097 RepID=A0A655D891_SALET|nr:Uncharacterised protein [Salmonella enterica subsp. enterica serovar Bovismorbificans]